jgi:hypothetical protein
VLAAPLVRIIPSYDQKLAAESSTNSIHIATLWQLRNIVAIHSFHSVIDPGSESDFS